MGSRLAFLSILFCGGVFWLAVAEPTEDKHALLDFINNIQHSRRVNWEYQTSACTGWVGVTCNHHKSRVTAVRLPGFGFAGSIPSNTLSRLSELKVLDLRTNNISGLFPSDFSKLHNLTALDLQYNDFRGPLPFDFSAWKNLSSLNLSNNKFNGSIPSSLSNLTQLTTLSLANNSLSGSIPDLNPSLRLLDLSNNNLTGIVPQSLRKFHGSAFSGNHLSPVPIVISPSASSPKHKSKKLSQSAMLGIVIGGCALGFLAIAVPFILCYSKKEDKSLASPNSLRKSGSLGKAAFGSTDGGGNMVFFEGCSLAFDLEDLLRASAEILGKGASGVVYKAALEDATTVVVKRLKEVSVGRKEFEQHLEVVGNIRHENVAPLRAYFYSKDEKLMVYDYYSLGSVSAMLHDIRRERRSPLDWETRVQIAVGAARGIAYIHRQSGGKLVHGNIKSSNIFLNSQHYGCVSDLGLATLIAPMSAPLAQTAGYCPPEVTDTRKATQASDVYSFGVLLLELLTGKSPMHATGGDEFVHIVRWVHSVVREEWTAEVFDIVLLRSPNIEEEMVEMLQIGMNCVARLADQRPRMGEVVKMVEGIRKMSSGNQTESSTPTLHTPPIVEIGSSYPYPH
nr:probable inactive receptor kinase At4g23740 [Ipomoea batatas]